MKAGSGTNLEESEQVDPIDIIIVGAGFAGLYMLYRLRAAGFNVKVFEAGADVGGTWYWNRYPGARCDIESMQYSYSFDEDLQQEWEWTERFATQPEILRYINHVTARFSLREHIIFDTTVTNIWFDETTCRWTVVSDRGNRHQAAFCIMATGCLSAAQVPDFDGFNRFTGQVYHTARWPHEGVDFNGQHVAVIGTGSSGIQSIPEIAKQAEHLYVLQRTPNYSIPARNAPLAGDYVESWKSSYSAFRHRARTDTPSGTIYDFPVKSALGADEIERQRHYQARWNIGGANFMHSYNDLLIDEEANKTAGEFVRSKIRQIVKDSQTADWLCPVDYPIFTKRICIDDHYFETYNRDNVTLVNLRETPLQQFHEHGIQVGSADITLDSVVFATGFDAITGALNAIDIRGKGGRRLSVDWADGPKAYLGLMSAGYPNLFMITGPGSPSVLSNMIVSIEQHVEWISELLEYMRAGEFDQVEPTYDAQEQWVEHVTEVANDTLFPRAASWYMGANIPGKPRIFMPYIGIVPYRNRCDAVARNGYEGFVLSKRIKETRSAVA